MWDNERGVGLSDRYDIGDTPPVLLDKRTRRILARTDHFHRIGVSSALVARLSGAREAIPLSSPGTRGATSSSAPGHKKSKADMGCMFTKGVVQEREAAVVVDFPAKDNSYGGGLVAAPAGDEGREPASSEVNDEPPPVLHPPVLDIGNRDFSFSSNLELVERLLPPRGRQPSVRIGDTARMSSYSSRCDDEAESEEQDPSTMYPRCVQATAGEIDLVERGDDFELSLRRALEQLSKVVLPAMVAARVWRRLGVEQGGLCGGGGLCGFHMAQGTWWPHTLPESLLERIEPFWVQFAPALLEEHELEARARALEAATLEASARSAAYEAAETRWRGDEGNPHAEFLVHSSHVHGLDATAAAAQSRSMPLDEALDRPSVQEEFGEIAEARHGAAMAEMEAVRAASLERSKARRAPYEAADASAAVANGLGAGKDGYVDWSKTDQAALMVRAIERDQSYRRLSTVGRTIGPRASRRSYVARTSVVRAEGDGKGDGKRQGSVGGNRHTFKVTAANSGSVSGLPPTDAAIEDVSVQEVVGVDSGALAGFLSTAGASEEAIPFKDVLASDEGAPGLVPKEAPKEAAAGEDGAVKKKKKKKKKGPEVLRRLSSIEIPAWAKERLGGRPSEWA